MKKLLLLLIILLIPALAYADEDDWFYRSENLILDVSVSSEASINTPLSDYDLKYINVNLSHYPYEDFDQEVISLETFPDAKIEGNAMLFAWDNPKGKVSFGYDAKIKTGNHIAKIKEKIKFPILEIPKEIEQFTKPSEIIDSDDEDVRGYASELAEGEDDLYVVVNKIAEWTKYNIEYNLSTLTAEVSQKASWVMDNRKGVCDELTSLFIAMLRSLGIPAKFVSGVAYTNSELFDENWGSHGWAEVYFPGYGWVPYDVTYGQFAYLDPTHVKLKESIDSGQPSVQYRWIGRNVDKNDLITKKLDINVSVDEKIGRVEDVVNLEASAQKENAAFGSYNLIEVVLENPEDYYTSTELYLSKPKELVVIGDDSQSAILKPSEKKSFFWIVKLSEDLQDNFIYTMPITVRTSRGGRAETSFKSKKDDISYSYNEMNSILQQKKEEEVKAYSREVNLDCNLEHKEFYYYEESKLNCLIKNEGNAPLSQLSACFENDCQKTDLGIAQEKEFNYTINNATPGKKESAFKVENNYVSKAEYMQYIVLDAPKITIKEIKAPESVEYGDKFSVEFLLSKESLSIPKHVKINFAHDNLEQALELAELFENRKIVVNMEGKELRKGLNELTISVEYEDDNGEQGLVQESFVIGLVNVGFFQNVILNLNHFINSIFR